MSCGKFIDLTGQKIGKLTVISQTQSGKYNNGCVYSRWICKCDCGNVVIRNTGNLRKMIKKSFGSCGCEKTKKLSELKTTHGKKNQRIYNIWCGMKSRCFNPNVIGFKNYGGKGIGICQEWVDDFISFYNWAMENGYNDELTIDRINVNENYCPENCRWVTRKEQNNNTTKNVLYTYGGKTQNISQWSKEYQINYKVLRDRLRKLNWDIEKALLTPVRRNKK